MPRTKQAAAKSSGKGKNMDISSSSEPVPEIPNPPKRKTLLPERGFNLENPNPDFLATVAALGWQKFITHRKEFIATLVHDFYKGIVERDDGEPSTISNVRGEEVKFGVRAINDYFGLGYYGKAVEVKQKTYGVKEMAEIKDRVCIEGAVWERRGDQSTEFKVQRSYLCDEANTWFHFIRHSLLPTSHTSWVDKERMIIIDAIMSRDKIEVGKLINREINKWKNRKDGYLYFPCLITDLCMEAGVEIEASELREKPQGAFPTKFKARQRASSVTTSVDAQTLQRLVEQQNSMAKFIREQFEWQKKVNAYITKGKMTIEEPVLPEWMKEEDEDNILLSSVQLRAVKEERAKRARSTTKGRSPAKKKQKKVISEESEEPEKASAEILSDDEEEEENAEERGSSSDKTDIQADSPPTKTTKSKSPQSKSQNQPIPQPSPMQSEPQQQQQPPKGFRMKSVPKTNPFGKKSRKDIAAQGEGTTTIQEEATAAQVAAKEKREKLQVKKKSVAPKGKPATATSAAFVAASGSESAQEVAVDLMTSGEKAAAERLVEMQAGLENEEAEGQAQDKVIAAGDVSTDVTTSNDPEVAKAPVDPKEPAPAMKAWEEAKKRIAEASTQRPHEAEASVATAATSSMAGSEETPSVVEVGEEKKKKDKKKIGKAGIPPRQSTRLRSGAMNK